MKAIASYIVTIPAYNEESTILQALDSVYEASLTTRARLSTIVVCINGCTDTTEQLVRSWNKAPLVVISSEPGLVPAMNSLISYAHRYHGNDAFIKIDGDGLIDPKAFQYVLDQLDTHPELMFTGGHPYPITNKSLPIWRRFVGKVTSVRGRVHQAEVAVREVSKYHTHAATDPLPLIGKREEKLKIYFHGRLWCMRKSGELPLLPDNAIGEDVYLPGWALKTYGTASIRVDYRAKVYFRPNDSLVRHWKVYRRVHEDRHRIYTTFDFGEYAVNCPLKLDWNYIFTQAPKKELVYFLLYGLLVKIEQVTFKMTVYRDSYWHYQEKEA